MGDAAEGGTWESLPIELRVKILKSISARERLREINAAALVHLGGDESCGQCWRCCCAWVQYVERVCYMSSQDWATRATRSWLRDVNMRILWETIKLYADILMCDAFTENRACSAQSRLRLLALLDSYGAEDAAEALHARHDAFVRPRLPCLVEYVDMVRPIPTCCDAVIAFRARYESRFGRLFGLSWGNAGRSALWNVQRYTARAMHARADA